MSRTLLGIIGALSGLLLLVGLTFSRAATEIGQFRFVNGTEPKTLDPQMMTGEPEARLCAMLFEGLTRREAKTLHPVPGVAESWDISPDGLTYTFHLRSDARWTDGHPVTAADFVFGWTRLLEPKSPSEYGYILFPVRHAEAFSTFEGHAAALEGPIAAALKALVDSNPEGLDAAKWQRFLVKNKVFDPLKTDTAQVMVGLLGRRQGSVTRDELRAFAAGCHVTALRLRAEAKHASAHFGVDEGVFVRDARTLVVEMRAPTPYFLEITAFHSAMPAPRWAVDAHPNDWFLPPHLVSNGPFSIRRWLVNNHIQFERSNTYWGKSDVHLKSVDALSLESETTALNLYLTGDVDWLPDTYPKDLSDELKGRADFYKTPGMAVYFYRLNSTRPPFNDRRVREAVNLAIDRSLITDQVLGLGQLPAATFVPPGLGTYRSPETGIRLDVDRARALLAEAGYPSGKGFPEVGILYNTSGQHKKIAEAIADQLKRHLGIAVNAYNQEWQSYLDTVRNGDYAMSRAAWVGDYADPNTFLDMWTTNGGNNETGFSSPLYDRLITAAADVSSFLQAPESILGDLGDAAAIRAEIARVNTAPSPDARLAALASTRLALLREAEGVLVRKEFPIVPVYFYVVSGLLRPNVRGFYTTLEFPDGSRAPNLMSLHPLRDVWLEPGTERTP
jgi:oligopeptide transport system substrate-binding protein